MLNSLKKTKNAWSLIFFNRQVLPANELFIVESFLAFMNLTWTCLKAFWLL